MDDMGLGLRILDIYGCSIDAMELSELIEYVRQKEQYAILILGRRIHESATIPRGNEYE